MIGRTTGSAFATARDFIARGLVRIGVSPNMLTLTGMVITAGAGVCFALGAERFAWSLDPRASANAWLVLAGVGLVLASACDMLDGAVARIGDSGTRFGAFLDSTLDRYSDFVVFAGIAIHYAARNPANITFVLLSMVAFFNAFMISYTRARAEDLIDACRAGYWQRGERSAAILIGAFACNIPAMVLQQAMLPLMTVWRRMSYTRAVLAGRDPHEDVRKAPWWIRVQPWRWPRMSVPYDAITIANIAWLIFAPVGAFDVIRRLVE